MREWETSLSIQKVTEVSQNTTCPMVYCIQNWSTDVYVDVLALPWRKAKIFKGSQVRYQFPVDGSSISKKQGKLAWLNTIRN